MYIVRRKSIELPVSKSIANRILLLQAIHGDELLPVSADMPEDVIVLHDALAQIRATFGIPGATIPTISTHTPLTLNLHGSGTALRFLEVHIAKCYPNAPITLTGDARLMERRGKPTTQTTSALILHGEDVPVEEKESPYITMSRSMAASYSASGLTAKRSCSASGLTAAGGLPEYCWSSAAFWYEYVAIRGGELLLKGLTDESLQGDRIVADIYAKYFGVETEFTAQGAVINLRSTIYDLRCTKEVSIDFTNCPDLYPAIALTCERLGVTLHATGTERLRYKESDRLEAVRLHEVRNDHRMAMALMAADYQISAVEQLCVSKSYPRFLDQFVSHITPIKGVNDDNKGKKYALSKLIHNTNTRYVWLHDNDIVKPHATLIQTDADLVILPLRMESEQARPNLLARLQIAEYAAIQEITMRTAKRGKAVMCSGANLIVRRDAWLECEGDLHPEIPSGDDMFLLEAMKRRGMKISVIDEPEYTATIRPETTWRAFFRQRMRWAGKAPKYTDRDIIRCGALVACANLLQVLCPPVILIKFPIEYSLIKKREPQTSWLVALLLEVLYPFYMLVCLIGGLVRSKEW